MFKNRKKRNINGKKFEYKTRLDEKLINNNFIKKSTKNDYYFYKNYDIDNQYKEIYVFEQHSFNNFIESHYNINNKLFRIYDLVILTHNKINDELCIHIYEKKYQNVEGSIETKLWASIALKRELELFLYYYSNINVRIYYNLLLNKFLYKKFQDKNNVKYNILKIILKENNINYYSGDTRKYKHNMINIINKNL